MELSTSVCVKAGLFSHPSSLTCPKDILKFSIITTQSRRNWRSRTSLLRISELQRPQKSIVLAMATGKLQEALPPVLDSTSEPPSIFDGTTRLYICYKCPFAQRVWIARNYKGLQDTIKLVPIDLQNRPSWYKEKVYPKNKVPSLEHNNEVRGESLDLIKYINENFEGLPLLPDDPAKVEFTEELISYCDKFNATLRNAFVSKGDIENQIREPLDHLECALSRFGDGPFFLGQFSMVDIAYAPFIERYEPFLADVWKYDIAAGRPKLASWIEEINKIEAYIQTKNDPKVLVEGYKQRYEEISLSTVN
ncbi:protein IN2-1 homolog B-like isoform X2 [Aristolochia californica]|uniref:protein IN2-1 homolog B-like isoform X2 n=1 Tax=Aristolochia californica TaxID=171875 RepID=UPI0035DC7E03